VAVAEDLLVWLDHREGDYRVAAKDLISQEERFLSGPKAVIGANMAPAADHNAVAWADRRGGDWDLYLFRF
jgi:hypothetical protein